MFAGASMREVETDRDAKRDTEEGGGVISSSKARIKQAFYRAQDEARDMFQRVRRSFDDFINRD